VSRLTSLRGGEPVRIAARDPRYTGPGLCGVEDWNVTFVGKSGAGKDTTWTFRLDDGAELSWTRDEIFAVNGWEPDGLTPWETMAEHADEAVSMAVRLAEPVVEAAARTLSETVTRARPDRAERLPASTSHLSRMRLDERTATAAEWEGRLAQVEVHGRRRTSHTHMAVGRVLAVARSYSNPEAADVLILRTPEDDTLSISLAQIARIHPCPVGGPR
jgi:hypothetical protein